MKKREIHLSATMQKAVRKLSKYFPHVLDDLKPLANKLKAGETPGDAIPGFSHQVYKARVASSDQRRGKRGGFRVVYYLVASNNVIHLLTLYAKSRQENIRPDEITQLIQELGL